MHPPKTSESWNSLKNDLTFTEEEVGKVVEFINVMSTKAVFNGMTLPDMGRVHSLYVNMIQHVKICEAHIMELKAVVQQPKAK